MKPILTLITALLFFCVLSPAALLAQGNQALLCDGVSGGVEIQNNNGIFDLVQAWTIEAWVKPFTANAGFPSNGPIIWKTARNGLNEDTYWLGWGSGDKFSAGLERASDGEDFVVESPPHAINQFHHVVGVYDGLNVQVFVNGVLENSRTIGSVTAYTGPAPLKIGDLLNSNHDGSRVFNGLIDEVRVWNRARAEEEIRSTMNQTLTGNEHGLVGYWNFDDGTANDLSPNGNHGQLKGDAKIVESDLTRTIVGPQLISPPITGETFTVGIGIDTDASLHDFTFDLTFDPTVLRATRVQAGTFLSKNGTDAVTCPEPAIGNGRITGIACQRNSATGVTGAGTLATITFEALKVGESTLRIENGRFLDAAKQEMLFGTWERTVTVSGQHGIITGRVVTFAGKPVWSAEVVALKDNTLVGTAKTDGVGVYAIEGIDQAGSYTVRATLPGLIPAETLTSVQVGAATADVNFVLDQPTDLYSIVDSGGFIRNWLLLGPILWAQDANRLSADLLHPDTQPDDPFPAQEGRTKALLPQEGAHSTGLAKTLRWTLHVDTDGDIDLAALHGQVRAAVYAFTAVKSPREQLVTLRIGSDDGVAVWLNDQLAHLNGTRRTREADQDEIAELTLQKGWNRLLIKVENQAGAWGFLARFTQPDGTPLTDLEIAPQLPSGDSGRRRAQLHLTQGVNMLSLPLKPDISYTASSLTAALNATVIIRVDDSQFDAYVRAGSIGTNFPIEMGKGYIVNLTAPRTFEVIGEGWGDPIPAAPPTTAPAAEPWAFVVAGQVNRVVGSGDASSVLHVTNSRTRETHVVPISPSGEFVTAFVDLSQRPVVAVGDELLIQPIGAEGLTVGTSQRLVLRQPDLAQAYRFTRLTETPERTHLLQNYPNPFNPETWIPYQLASDAQVQIAIYDIRGSLVRQLDLGHQVAGFYLDRPRAAYWDGRNRFGERVASGVYVYQLRAGDYAQTRKMVILK